MRKFKKRHGLKIILCALVISIVSCRKNNQDIAVNQNPSTGLSDIQFWTTSGNRAFLFRQSATGLSFGTGTNTVPVIEIDTTQQFQSIDGFGYALTGGSAYLINQKLNATQRDALMKELFLSDNNNIGISYLRISMGASDLDDHVFSYDDLSPGETDVTLAKFSLAPDQQNLIPVLKQILAVNPDLKIMGSPWSAPVWMKNNNNSRGGSLRPEYYRVYADYFVKYIQGMAKEGIRIDAITLQNEPENPNNNPSLVMTAVEQANFIKNELGPAFKASGLTAKIVVYDHNCDHPDYPITILNDPDVKKYVDGSAFHLYSGTIEALSEVHNAHADRSVYFTEQWTSSQGDFAGDLRWHIKNLIIGATRNWSRNVLEWNLAADPAFRPHTDGGCTQCLGALTIGDSVLRNVSYYIIAHASKFVRPGSVRVASSITNGLPNVAFVTPEGKKVLIVLNDGTESKTFGIKFKDKLATASLPGGAVGTFVW
jgi:glucosylceramidase